MSLQFLLRSWSKEFLVLEVVAVLLTVVLVLLLLLLLLMVVEISMAESMVLVAVVAVVVVVKHVTRALLEYNLDFRKTVMLCLGVFREHSFTTDRCDSPKIRASLWHRTRTASTATMKGLHNTGSHEAHSCHQGPCRGSTPHRVLFAPFPAPLLEAEPVVDYHGLVSVPEIDSGQTGAF